VSEITVEEKSVEEKTKALKRVFLPIEVLFVNELNPNEMTDSQFNLLFDNMGRTGFTDPLLVRRIGDRYRIIGGAHRFEVAKLHGLKEVPATIIDDPDFDEDQEKYQIVRMNVIRGKMSPQSFFKLYESLDKKYSAEVMSESFGFVKEEEFRKLIGTISKSLPKINQSGFVKAALELKTIEGLSKLLNSMFTKYGDTLPYGYMVLDFGGKDSVWLRMGNETKKAMDVVGKICIDNNRTVDSIIGGLVQLIAQGKLSEQVKWLVENSPEVKVEENGL